MTTFASFAGLARIRKTLFIITYKSISLNRNGLSPTNERAGQLKETFVTPLQRFIANREFTKEIEPPMTPFDHPSPPSRRRFRDTVCRRAALLQRRRIPFSLGGLPGGLAGVPFLPAQILGGEGIRLRSPNDPLGQRLRHQRDIRRFGAADDQRQGDAATIHQQAPLASIFFPDPSGSVQPPLAPTALCSTSRQYSAISRRYMTSRHTPRGRPARGVQRSQRPASARNVDEGRWDSRRDRWATPSIGCQFGGHTRCRRRPAEEAMACGLLLVCEHIPGFDRAVAPESAAQHVATTPRRLPTMERCVFVSSRNHQ